MGLEERLAQLIPPQWLRRITERTVQHNLGPCWELAGWNSGNGYAKVKVQGKCKMAHREFYERAIGPIPDGAILDHLCDNRGCVRPLHMDPVTNRENTWRGKAVLFS